MIEQLRALPLVEEVREVTHKDRWCRFPKKPKTEICPYGYILVTSRPGASIDLGKIDGVIVRSKKIKNKLLLQVFPNQKQTFYGVDCKSAEFGQKNKKTKKGKNKVRKKRRHILNVKSNRKRKGRKKKI